MSPTVFSNMVSNLLYEKRFGPYFCEPVICGLEGEANKPYLCGMDLLGAQVYTDDFILAGDCPEAMYGLCESLYKPVSAVARQHARPMGVPLCCDARQRLADVAHPTLPPADPPPAQRRVATPLPPAWHTGPRLAHPPHPPARSSPRRVSRRGLAEPRGGRSLRGAGAVSAVGCRSRLPGRLGLHGARPHARGLDHVTPQGPHGLSAPAHDRSRAPPAPRPHSAPTPRAHTTRATTSWRDWTARAQRGRLVRSSRPAGSVRTRSYARTSQATVCAPRLCVGSGTLWLGVRGERRCLAPPLLSASISWSGASALVA